MFLYDYILSNYNHNKPIIIKQLWEALDDQITYNSLKVYLKRLVEKGLLNRYANGIYYYKNQDSTHQTLELNDILTALYLKKDGKAIGYLSGIAFAHSISLTSVIPTKNVVVTNEESSRKRDIKIADDIVTLRAPRVEVDDDNVRILQLLDLITEYDNIIDVDTEVFNQVLDRYLDEHNIIFQDLLKYLNYYPARTSQKLIKSCLIA